MGTFSFLKNAVVAEVEPKKSTGGGVKKDRSPAESIENAAIRVWKDGSVYPNQKAIQDFDLHYRSCTVNKIPVEKENDAPEIDDATGLPVQSAEVKTKNEYVFVGTQGNGLDFIDTRVWTSVTLDSPVILVAPIPKEEPKVDLFASVRYDDNGTPKSNVADQGSPNEDLVTAIKEVYGIELNEDLEYVDLEILSEVDGFNITENFSKPLAAFPKKIIRGSKKGDLDFILRKEAKIYLLAPVEATTETAEVSAPTEAIGLDQGDLSNEEPYTEA